MLYSGWIGFALALITTMVIGRKNLWVGFLCGALVLSVFTLSVTDLMQVVAHTFGDYSVLLLALSVGLIPIIGTALNYSGLMNDLVDNLHMSRKTFLMFGPALLGMLPMPGGALLSAPLVMRAGTDIPDDQYVAINVWYRHALILIYPLGALLAISKMAGVHLYTAILYVIPAFILMMFLGHFFLLRGINGRMGTAEKSEKKKVFIPLMIILIAPGIHVLLMLLFPHIISEIPLVIGVVCSLMVAWKVGKLSIKHIVPLTIKSRPWKFSLIIVMMFLFLHTFEASHLSDLIATVVHSRSVIIVFLGAALAFVTGRTQLAFSIVLPIFFARFGREAMNYSVFALMFFSTYMGYIISPIHPCVCVTLEFFGTDLLSFYKRLLLPALLCLGAAFLLSYII